MHGVPGGSGSGWIWISVLVLSAGAACAGRSGSDARSMVHGAEQPPPVEATSFLGEPLRRPVIEEPARSRMEAQLLEARREWARDSMSADALIWVGRRTAYLGRYNEAIELFSLGVRLHPEDARFYRHRGHRYITVRQLDRAIADFETAARLIEGMPDQVEPDGMPNPRGIPTSTLHFNIWYHLGLARYLNGDLTGALVAYRRCLEASANPDAVVATLHWMYMTMRRLGQHEEALRILEPVRADMDIIENHAYHRLTLMYRGDVSPDSLRQEASGRTIQDVTTAYGVANWYLLGPDTSLGERMLHDIVSRGQWPAFGHIAAEADLARRRSAGGQR